MHICKHYIGIFITLFFLTNLSFAKNKIYIADNTAAVAIIPTAESSYNLQFTLKPQDNFTNWDIGFFMLKVFLDPAKTQFTAQICKQKFCVPLALDTISDNPAKSITDYLKPELSFGHVTLFKPTKPFKLEDGNTYIISINGLKNIPKNITAMPQGFFLSANNHQNIIPLTVTGYTGYNNKDGSQERNQNNWDVFENPPTIDSVVVPYPQKTVFTSGTTKAITNKKIHYCTQVDGATECRAITNQVEGYVLQIAATGITIYTNTPAGVFYAGQTLAQLASYPVDVLSQRIAKLPTHAADVACIKSREDYINTQKLGFISLKELPKYLPKIKAGDMIGIVRTPNGKADSVYHLGIAYIHDGKVGMIHASSKQKKVVIADTITEYLGQFDNSQGIILLRAR